MDAFKLPIDYFITDDGRLQILGFWLAQLHFEARKSFSCQEACPAHFRVGPWDTCLAFIGSEKINPSNKVCPLVVEALIRGMSS